VKIKTIVIIVLLNSVLYADACMKWLPIPTGDGLIVVVPINKGNPYTTNEDLDCDGIIDEVDNDIDGDGVLNNVDDFPKNQNESKDTDNDGVGDNKDRPTANSQRLKFDGYSDQYNITLSGKDDSNVITFTVVSQPLHGTLTGTIPNLVYTPDTYYVGNDSFTYSVNDGSLNSSIVTISINIEAHISKGVVQLGLTEGATISINSLDGHTFIDNIITDDKGEYVINQVELKKEIDNYNPHFIIPTITK